MGTIPAGSLVRGSARAAYALLLIACLLVPGRAALAAGSGFSDIEPGASYAVPVRELAASNILRGYGNGTFGPHDALLRVQAAGTLVRVAGLGGTPVRDFSDRGTMDEELWTAVRLLADHGVVRGYADGTFAPTRPVSRQEAVSLVVRTLEATGRWQARGGGSYGDVVPDHAADVATYRSYVGEVPGAGATLGATTTAERGWYAELLWSALKATAPAPAPASAPATGKQHIFVPFYVNPTDPNWGSDWARMSAAVPSQSVVILDIGIGASSSRFNGVVRSQIQQAQAAGLRVLGYVPTNWGTGAPVNGYGRALGDIDGYVDQWYAWYGVDGIYFDEADQWPATQAFYRHLRDHVRAEPAARGTEVWLNVSAYLQYEGIMQVGDVIQTFEARYADGSDWNYQNYRQPAWLANYPPSRFAHTILSCSTDAQVRDAVARARQRGAGYVYAFDGNNVPGDGYDRLPAAPLWASQLAAVAP